MDVKYVVVFCALLITHVFGENSTWHTPANRTVCQQWQDLVLSTLDDVSQTRRRKRDTDCLESIDFSKLSGTYGIGAPGRRKRQTEQYDHKCLSKSIMKCLFYIDNEHFFSNDTHIFGNITVNMTYIRTNLTDNLSLGLNISNMVVPLLHADNINHTYFKERNNTWPWCVPDIPGKKLNIRWWDTLIPPTWFINATSISVSAFGFEFIETDNVTKFVYER
nr:protein E31 [Elephant endotheliotropic herpesvirus 1A]